MGESRKAWDIWICFLKFTRMYAYAYMWTLKSTEGYPFNCLCHCLLNVVVQHFYFLLFVHCSISFKIIIENEFPHTSTSRMAHHQVWQTGGWSPMPGAIAPPGGHSLTAQSHFQLQKGSSSSGWPSVWTPTCPWGQELEAKWEANTVWFVGMAVHAGVYLA